MDTTLGERHWRERARIGAAMDLTKLVIPVLGAIVRAAIERPVGAGLVAKPAMPEGKLKIPGRRVASLTRGLSKTLISQVSDSLGALREIEFNTFDDDEWEVAVTSAYDSLSKITPLTATKLLQLDLDPESLFRAALKADANRSKVAGLSESQTAAYERILMESAWHIVEFCTRQPEFPRRIEVELLRRVGDLGRNVNALSQTTGAPDILDFERRYSDLVLAKLDKLQLFGVTLRHSGEYSLSTAYLSLHATPEKFGRTAAATVIERLRVNEALAGATRVLIRGEAGSGKTTLLQWLAVNSVRSPETLPDGWHAAIPFIVPLRRFWQQDLPTPDQFPREVAPALSAETPKGWVSELLKSGRALVLIDGVDELPNARRGDVWIWLHDLVITYPNAKYVITSRPPAADGKLLVPDNFQTFMLLPLGVADVRAFVAQWHHAMAANEPQERRSVAAYKSELLDKLARRRDLRRLATNPLLCALICALHLDRYQQLPRDRMGLYRAALEMLLVRRDEARGIQAEVVGVSQQDQEILLGQLAYWLVRNGRSDADRVEATARLSRYMKSMPYVEAKPSAIMEYLLLRSGVLREPVVGRIDFLHKTFQEYLAARAILDDGDLDAMLRHAHEDNWREVVVLAVGHGRRGERERIIRGLIERGDRHDDLRRRLHLLAASCLEHAGSLDPRLSAIVREKAARLVVPRDHRQVDLIASAGEVVLDLVPNFSSLTDAQGSLLIDVINRFDTEDSFPVLARIAQLRSRLIRAKLAAAWPRAVVEGYADTVLADMRLDDLTVCVRGERQALAAARLERLRSLLIQDAPGALQGLKNHPSLRTLMLDSSDVEDISALRTLGALRNFVVYGTRIPDGLKGISGLNLEELALLNAPRGVELDDYIPVIASFAGLRRLTIDSSFLRHSEPLFALGANIERLDLMLDGWMAGLIDYAYREAAWLTILRQQRSTTWRRPRIEPLRQLGRLREISLCGWPSTNELGTLNMLENLETLRIIVPDDEFRLSVVANGFDYPYPDLVSGMRRTSYALSSLRRFEISILSLDNWGKVSRPDGSSIPTIVSALTGALPRGHRPSYFVNGLAVKR